MPSRWNGRSFGSMWLGILSYRSRESEKRKRVQNINIFFSNITQNTKCQAMGWLTYAVDLELLRQKLLHVAQEDLSSLPDISEEKHKAMYLRDASWSWTFRLTSTLTLETCRRIISADDNEDWGKIHNLEENKQGITCQGPLKQNEAWIRILPFFSIPKSHRDFTHSIHHRLDDKKHKVSVSGSKHLHMKTCSNKNYLVIGELCSKISTMMQQNLHRDLNALTFWRREREIRHKWVRRRNNRPLLLENHSTDQCLV